MSNLNRVQKQKSCAIPMKDRAETNDPVQEIISLIQTNPDPQVMLTAIATILGTYFQVDMCLVVAESHAGLESLTGFWNQKKSTHDLGTTQQLLLDSGIKSMVVEKGLVAIPDVATTAKASKLNQLKTLLPVKGLLALTTQFGQEFNGFIVLATLKVHDWSQEEQNLILRCSQIVGIANSMVRRDGSRSSTGVDTPTDWPIKTAPAPEVQGPNQKAEMVDNINPSLPFNTGSRSLAGDNLFKKWYQLTRQQLEQQRQLNELKDDIITTISHEAGTPLATMKLAIQMLCDRKAQLSSESQERYWGILKQEWQRLHDLINNIKTLQLLKSTELSVQRQKVDLSFIFKEIVQLFQEQWQKDKRKRLNLVTEGLISPEFQNDSKSFLTLDTDPQHFRSILMELLTNAGKFATPETTVSIDVTQQQQGKEKNLVITINNMGEGILPEDQEQIFEPFRRGQGMTDKAIPGTGLGLTLVKGLVELLDGRIEVTSHQVKESNSYLTSFSIILSQSQS